MSIVVLGLVQSDPSLFAKVRDGSCATVLTRFIYQNQKSPQIEAANQILATKDEDVVVVPLETLEKQPKTFRGVDSDEIYKTEWLGLTSLDGSQAILDFKFISQNPAEFAHVSVDLRAVPITLLENGEATPLYLEDSQAHQIEVDLPRDRNGNFKDPNLLYPVLELLFQRAVPDEAFEYILNEPAAVDALNEHFHEDLQSIQFVGDFPQRENNVDSAFQVLDPINAHELLQALRDPELHFEQDMTEYFLKQTALGSIFKQVDKWQVQVSIEAEQPQENDSWEGPDEIGLKPLYYHYKIRLSALR